MDKDFYTASYNLTKTEHLNIYKENIFNISLFINGVIKKIKEFYEIF